MTKFVISVLSLIAIAIMVGVSAEVTWRFLTGGTVDSADYLMVVITLLVGVAITQGKLNKVKEQGEV